MSAWWERDIMDAGKLPLTVCLLAFILTFVATRAVTRSIRAGRGPFRNQRTASGVHVHHAVPGMISLIVGAFIAVDSDREPWNTVAGFLVGAGVSLVLDEFALILHLSDVYWQKEGRLSVDLVMLAAACLALALIGFSPVGVSDVDDTELTVRLGATAVLLTHGLVIGICVLKGKLRLALIGLFVPLIASVGVVRLARPGSFWYRHRYRPARQAKADAAAARFDRRWGSRLHALLDAAGGHRDTESRIS